MYGTKWKKSSRTFATRTCFIIWRVCDMALLSRARLPSGLLPCLREQNVKVGQHQEGWTWQSPCWWNNGDSQWRQNCCPRGSRYHLNRWMSRDWWYCFIRLLACIRLFFLLLISYCENLVLRKFKGHITRQSVQWVCFGFTVIQQGDDGNLSRTYKYSLVCVNTWTTDQVNIWENSVQKVD
jgi:hypothetical protein